MYPDTIRWAQGPDGIVTLTLDDPNQSANTMTRAYAGSMRAAVDRLEAERESVTGVIITSAKKTFFAGGDLKDMLATGPDQAAEFFAFIEGLKADLRRLETLGRPVVAAINGAALGGGLEIALACHHRIALDTRDSRVGLPEVTLGLLPGGGGVTRTVRMLGLTEALNRVLLDGRGYSPAEAVDAGLINEVAATPEEMLAAARAWIGAHPGAVQPWDANGCKPPGGSPAAEPLATVLSSLPAMLRVRTQDSNLPAPRAILAAAVEGAQVDIDTALTIESRHLTKLVTGQVSKNMIKGFFFDPRHIRAGGSRPVGFPRHTVRKVAVLGAGTTGAGIALACAQSGVEVVLKDVTREAAERGRESALRRAENPEPFAPLIRPAGDPADVAGADLVIEAVFEDPELKAKVFAEIQPAAADAVLSSSTSTLPITGLAQTVERPQDFVGLHFFSSADRMHLLEIIVGEKTSNATLAKAIDFAQQIHKTPIVVNDSRGFFIGRVISAFLTEAAAMIGEGVCPSAVEHAGLQAGYPSAPLQLWDEITLTMLRSIRDAGLPWQANDAFPVIDILIDDFGREGCSTGGGFYDYDDNGRRTGLWPGLTEHFVRNREKAEDVRFEDIKERMLFAPALETVRCLEEGVLRSVPEANVGSLLGVGFPAWTGGTLQYINSYDDGLPGFVARARTLANRYGPRFEPRSLLLGKAADGRTFA